MTDAPVLSGEGTPRSVPASPSQDGIGLAPWLTPIRIALILWTVMSLMAIAVQWDAIAMLDLSDTDDAMRMAQVRDLLAGQGWGDLNQYRVNPAGGGVMMHWSRIVDAPLAAGILILKPLVGQPIAERAVMAIWPSVLGAMLSVACVLGYRDHSDRRIAWVAPLFLIMSPFIVAQFRPLRVDHHGWQILLAMLVMGQALRPASWRSGATAGLCAAALLAVSIEGLPMAALFAGIAALRWAWHGRGEDRARLCGYMGALAAGAMLFQFLTRGPAGLMGTWCDSLSAPYMAAFVAATAGVAAAALINSGALWVRLMLLAGAGLGAAAALLWVEPQCANGPFASLDPIVVKYWYQRVLEGQPLWVSKPADAIHVLVPSLVGLAGSLLAWRSCTVAADRRNWATIIAALIGAMLLSLFVLRTASTAHLFALPGCAWLGLRAWMRAREIASTVPRILASMLAALTLPLLGGGAVAAAFETAFPEARENGGAADLADGANRYREDCLDPAAIAALRRVPATTILTPIDLGAPMLFWTRHSVVATPHHRNREAMADTIRAFIGDPRQAEALVRKQRATLIVFCRTANDLTAYRGARDDGLAARLYAGKAPSWLEPMSIDSQGGLSVWRVKPPAR